MRMICVFVGGFLGGLARYLISEVMDPFGTFFVNMVGCFFLAWFLTYASKWRVEFALLFGTGFTGAFTTFSTLMNEAIQMRVLGGMTYIFASFLFGILFAFFGYAVGRIGVCGRLE